MKPKHRAELAKIICEFAGQLEQLREQELRKSVCSVCADAPCTCVKKGMPVPPKTPGLQAATAKNPVFGSHGKPAGMTKNDLCKTCSKPGDLCKCMSKAGLAPTAPTAPATPNPRSAAGIRGVPADNVKQPKTAPMASYMRSKAGNPVMGKGELKKDLESSTPSAAPATAKPQAGSRSAAHIRGAVPKTDPAGAKKAIPLSDLAGMVQRSKRKLPTPSLPGMTPGGPAASSNPLASPMSPESAQSINEAKRMHAEGAVAPGISPESAASIASAKNAQVASVRPGAATVANLRSKLSAVQGTRQAHPPAQVGAPAATSATQANQEIGGFKSIASNPTAMPVGGAVDPATAPAATPQATLANDKRAAGMGPLNNLFAKLKGKGNATWEQMRGAGPATDARVARTAGLQRNEINPTGNDNK